MGLIQSLREWIWQNSRSNESGSKRDGFLSYSAEWHALAVGAFIGVVAAATMNAYVFAFAFVVITGKAKVSNDHLRDAGKEVAYSGGGFVIAFGASIVATTLPL